MDTVQALFLEAEGIVNAHSTMDSLLNQLANQNQKFPSISFEGASFFLAFNELVETGKLQKWQSFAHQAAHHIFHIEIGLGWAFGKARINPEKYFTHLELHEPTLVYDGIGYYHALYKGRDTIINGQYPKWIDKVGWLGFDQGVGRRLWYHSKGDLVQLMERISTFESQRHPRIWRGIGIACAYVGGQSMDQLDAVLASSGIHRPHFVLGAHLALHSRLISDSLDPDIIDFSKRIIDQL